MSPAGTSVLGPHVPIELRHEALAEAHDLVVALALGVEVGPALAAAHREGRQRVLEHLLEGEELEDPEIDRGVEAQTALVRTDGAVHLDAEPALDAHRPLVVEPRHPEQNDALGLDDALEDALAPVLGVSVEHGAQRLCDLGDRLMELRLGGVLRFDVRHEGADVITHCCKSPPGAAGSTSPPGCW